MVGVDDEQVHGVRADVENAQPHGGDATPMRYVGLTLTPCLK